MGCYYEEIPDLGKVLIPGCIAVSVSNDLYLCTCYSYNNKKYSSIELIEKLKKENIKLKTELKMKKQIITLKTEKLPTGEISIKLEADKESGVYDLICVFESLVQVHKEKIGECVKNTGLMISEVKLEDLK